MTKPNSNVFIEFTDPQGRLLLRAAAIDAVSGVEDGAKCMIYLNGKRLSIDLPYEKVERALFEASKMEGESSDEVAILLCPETDDTITATSIMKDRNKRFFMGYLGEKNLGGSNKGALIRIKEVGEGAYQDNIFPLSTVTRVCNYSDNTPVICIGEVWVYLHTANPGEFFDFFHNVVAENAKGNCDGKIFTFEVNMPKDGARGMSAVL